jgi:hypothetical protein
MVLPKSGKKPRKPIEADARPFACILNFAGCKATFPNKNEWKRHIASQHVVLTVWICNQGSCGNAAEPNEFNRKDLFTQHLRRMHAPSELKRASAKSNKRNVEWEAQLKQLQESCMHDKKQLPSRMGCPVQGCGSIFAAQGAGFVDAEGAKEACRKAWEERMEHVGKHLDPVQAGKDDVVRNENDALFIKWAEAEGLIVRKASGGWRLPNAEDEIATGGDGEDEDADGEDED